MVITLTVPVLIQHYLHLDKENTVVQESFRPYGLDPHDKHFLERLANELLIDKVIPAFSVTLAEQWYQHQLVREETDELVLLTARLVAKLNSQWRSRSGQGNEHSGDDIH